MHVTTRVVTTCATSSGYIIMRSVHNAHFSSVVCINAHVAATCVFEVDDTPCGSVSSTHEHWDAV